LDNSESSSSLYEIILDVSTHLGFSVIPLTGKRPPKGFNYSKYQSQKPTSADLTTWFAADEFTAYGVVCGAVSNGLFVLDFDSDTAYQDFILKFPQIAESYTVKTRRGFHIYLSTDTALRTRKIPGGDLLAQGSLVVGAGSCVNDFCYSIAINAPILNLMPDSLQNLLLWATSSTEQPVIKPTSTNSSQTHVLSRLASLYQTQASIVGRNNALYKTALSAAQAGINQTETIGSLALLHVAAPAIGLHPHESAPERMQEAIATIASAYKGPHILTRRKTGSVGVPNALREYLLKAHQSTISARLLDIFSLAGWTAGRVFSTKEAVEIASQHGLSRSSVLAVLSGRLSTINEQRMIEHSEKTHSHSHSTDKPPAGEGDDRRFNSRGRKTNFYCVPDLALLCQICEIASDQQGSTDPLNAQDVTSEKAYRMAMHRELVRRTSPELSYGWHAARLNVSARTVRRYNSALGVIVTPIFGYRPLTWATIKHDDLWGSIKPNTSGRDITPGRWIQTSEGQRYPAIKGIAYTLLKAKNILIMCKQISSKFQLPVVDRPIIIYPCIWRHLDGTAPDWGGGEYEYPVGRVLMPGLSTVERHDERINQGPDEALIQFVNTYMARPQDLTVLKGVGQWYEKILNQAGITRYEHLAQADAERIKGLSGMGQYITLPQVSFWIDQARVISKKLVSVEALQGWLYKDWYDYHMERRRIENVTDTLRLRLVCEFREKGWLKYHGSLPAWFVELINT